MRSINYLPLALLLLAASPAIASDEPVPAAGPKAVVESPLHDAGVVPPANPVRHTFKVRNGGEAPLTILSVKPG